MNDLKYIEAAKTLVPKKEVSVKVQEIRTDGKVAPFMDDPSSRRLVDVPSTSNIDFDTTKKPSIVKPL